MNAPGPSTIALVVGKKQSGKTSLVKRGLARLARFVVWDVRGEYTSLPRARLWTDLRAFRSHLVGGGDVEREVFACPASQFEAWCRWVFATGNLVVVIEELSRHVPSNRASPALQDIFDRSRHAHLDVIVTTARPEKVPRELRAQVDDVLVAKMSEPNDVAYLASWLGGPVAARVRDLPLLTFLHVST